MTMQTLSPAASRFGDRAAKSVYLPLGLANPVWVAISAAAGAGAAWWMLTRWAKPISLDGLVAAPPAKLEPAQVGQLVEAAARPVAAAAAAIDEAVEAVAAAAQEFEPEPVVDTVATVAETAEGAGEAALQVDDDLTKLVGVGPRTAAAFAEHGVRSFADLAAWSEERLADFDAQLGLKGRSLRDGWIEQARVLARTQ
jgi:predicted flap endonuclease-1-like 5' DNA nuclease